MSAAVQVDRDDLLPGAQHQLPTEHRDRQLELGSNIGVTELGNESDGPPVGGDEGAGLESLSKVHGV
jgi:hypothetical protein